MSFTDIEIKNEYRTLESNIVNDFLLPMMCHSKKYQRAVGFFSSSAIACYAYGIAELIKNNGTVEIVASPKLSEEDMDAIDKGYSMREDVIESALLREMGEPRTIFEKKRLNLLAYYIAIKKLEIKIAYVEDGSSISIYHEKLGIFTDENNNKVCFTGSMNESFNAFSQNYETVDVFKSWIDVERVEEKIEAFNRIWNAEEPNLKVKEFSKVKKEFLRRYLCTEDELDFDVDQNEFKFTIEYCKRKKSISGISLDEDQLYDYQKQAIQAWKGNDYRGIYNMCTGAGKTYTAIGSIKRCVEDNQRLAVVIVVPFQHLVEQWVEDLVNFGIDPIIGYGAPKYKGYEEKLKKSIFRYNFKAKNLLCFITTNDSFIKDNIQDLLNGIKGDLLLVVDEAHNFGAETRLSKLTNKFNYRLALSATLDRHGDEVGTEALHKYFGAECINYTLSQAIEEDKLTKYEYYPIIVYLTPNELDKYEALSKELVENIKFDNNGNPYMSKKAQMIAINRARVVAGASEKINALREAIQPYRADNNMLVYCGAATLLSEDVENYAIDEDIRQIDRVTEVLGNELGMKVAQYTSKENIATREELKKQFEDGVTIQALVAIKCLDEGVNIPGIKTAFILASTTNPKEYIQRRGRVLRKAKGKNKACIYDFITLPRQLYSVRASESEVYKYDYSLIKNELNRVIEFKNLATNPWESDKLLTDIMDTYNLIETEDGIVEIEGGYTDV